MPPGSVSGVLTALRGEHFLGGLWFGDDGSVSMPCRVGLTQARRQGPRIFSKCFTIGQAPLVVLEMTVQVERVVGS